MLNDLFIIKLKEELRKKIILEFNKIKKKLDEEEFLRISEILEKEVITIDDVNDLLIDYLPYYCDDCKLIEFVKDKMFVDRVDNYIKYYIYCYLVDKVNNKDVSLIMKRLGYKYKITDVDFVSNYVSNKREFDNEKCFLKLEQIYNNLSDESLFKEKIEELVGFKDLVLSNMHPYDLVNAFYPLNRVKNLYSLLKNVEKIYKNTDDINDKKKLLMIYYTYNYKIDKNIDICFNGVSLGIEDVISFIKECEDRGIVLNEKRLINLFDNFRKRYYVENGLVISYKELCDKVISCYSDYYNKHFYFSLEEFCNYYNINNKDNFNIFFFDKDKEVGLSSNIMSSLFNNGDILESYFLLSSDVKGFKCFKNASLKSIEYDKEQKEYVNKRRKFYRKFKCKINLFLSREDECIKYFMLRNIKKEDRNTFFELFKVICGDKYKEIGFDRKKIRLCSDKLKKEFVLELFDSSYKDRMLVLERYKEYVKYIDASSYVRDDYFELMMLEYDRKFKLNVARNIVNRFKVCSDSEFVSLYEEILEYVQKELGLSSIDVIFDGLAKKKYAMLKDEYNKFKSKYLMMKMTGGLVKKRSVK